MVEARTNSTIPQSFVTTQKNAANLWVYSVCGTPGEARTHYIPLRRRTLYPAEVRGQIRFNPRQGTPNTVRLGGDRSILLSYGRTHSVLYHTCTECARGNDQSADLPWEI